MVNVFKSTSLDQNTFKTERIITKTLKKLLIDFTRRYYNPNATYANTILVDWEKKLVRFIVLILVNGFILFLSFYALLWVFPTISWIYIGSSPFQYLLAVVYLGLISCFLTKVYWYARKGYKEV